MNNLDRFADTRILSFGNLNVTLGGLVTGAIVLLVSLVLARLVSRTLRRVRERASYRASGALYLLEKLAGYGIVIVGVVAGLSAAGLNLSSLALFAGAIGIGIGLGLQGVVKEFVSGLFLIFDRMVSVGDLIELDDGVRGAIVEIGPRASRLRTNDNVNIIVPNSKLIEDRVTNWTLRGDTRRIHVPFSVAYGADRAQVRDAVLAAARTSPFTLPETDARKSQVWLVGFGESGLDFELLVWPTPAAVKRPAGMHAAYTWLIADALDAAGIEVPFPQIDLRLRSIFGREGDEAMAALGLQRPAAPAADARPRPTPTTNDAAEELLNPAHDAAGLTDDAPTGT
ncbi:MAG: mechanosensitive ion channel [Alphaproteobacteria bacterium]|jgi:small-conductance mechanosensitive channel|nr:mechanosensitive ion channel [Alphaproteobacteria bacterium]MBU2042795.1 mechanosensitive ion channel [Alphaproteobacteria bacterium]MBU2126477.1 mechanosensitive ion channel [Alphaproteobacteria bacterium]MBU2209680.1 mechanosensitive ion channel [Alphaproteobacteria bacterium]MBU2290822.1 mechanosensitive ion channel [Alphaproteobacteria bacterium]